MMNVDSIQTYKAKLLTVFPKHMRSRFHINDDGSSKPSFDGCMVGFSLGNSEFTLAKVRAMVEWIDKRFKKCVILIGDDIYRMTLLIDEGLTEAEALIKSRNIGKEKINEISPVVSSTSNCEFILTPCSQMVAHIKYPEFYRSLEYLYQNNAVFTRSVKDFSALFLSRRDQENEFHSYLSRLYLFEELSIMACTYNDGFHTFIYPGNLAIARELSSGIHPSAPFELTNMISVELDIKRRKQKSKQVECDVTWVLPKETPDDISLALA